MDFKSRIDKLSTEIKTLDDQATELQTQSFHLRQERETLITQMILEDGMLNNTDWDFTLDGGGLSNLNCSDVKQLPFLTELARTDYISSFELQDSVTLKFDEDNIYLVFKELKQVVPFVKKNKMNVSGQGMTARLAKLKRDASALETIMHQLGSIL